MKRIKHIFRTFISAAFAAAMLTGCAIDDPEGLAVTYIPEKIAVEGGTASFTVYPGSFGQWAAAVPQGIDWLDVNPANGNGETAVTVTVKPNTAFGDREAIVVVTAGDRDIPVKIIQEGIGVIFDVTPESLTGLPGDEGEQYIARSLEVTANIEWYAEITIENASPTYGDWVMFLPDNTSTHGSAASPAYGDATLDLFIMNYYDIGAPLREAKALFYDTNGELLQEVPISQNAPAIIFDVNPESLTGLPDNELNPTQDIPRSLSVTANVAWYAEIVLISGAGRWVVFQPDRLLTHGSATAPVYGDATLDLSISLHFPEDGFTFREAKVCFYRDSGEVLKEVPISQGTPGPAIIFQVTPASYLELPGDQANYNLSVTANIDWSADFYFEGDPTQIVDWMRFMPSRSDTYGPINGNAEITVQVDRFAGTSAGQLRSATIFFYMKGASIKSVPISQLSM